MRWQKHVPSHVCWRSYTIREMFSDREIGFQLWNANAVVPWLGPPIMSVRLFVKIRNSRWPFTGTLFLWMHIRQEIQKIISLSSKCQEILVSSIVVDRSMLIPIHFQQWINRWTNCDSIIPTTGRQIYRSSFYNKLICMAHNILTTNSISG